MDGCIHLHFIHLLFLSFNPVFLARLSAASVSLQADGTTGRCGELCARRYLFAGCFFHPCIVPSIPVSFSVHYTPHSRLPALVTPSVSFFLSITPPIFAPDIPSLLLASWYEDVDSRNWFQLAALYYWL